MYQVLVYVLCTPPFSPDSSSLGVNQDPNDQTSKPNRSPANTKAPADMVCWSERSQRVFSDQISESGGYASSCTSYASGAESTGGEGGGGGSLGGGWIHSLNMMKTRAAVMKSTLQQKAHGGGSHDEGEDGGDGEESYPDNSTDDGIGDEISVADITECLDLIGDVSFEVC